MMKCHDCGYDLHAHEPADRCPECGGVPDPIPVGAWVAAALLAPPLCWVGITAVLLVGEYDKPGGLVDDPTLVWPLIAASIVMPVVLLVALRPRRWSMLRAAVIGLLLCAGALASFIGAIIWMARDFL